MEVGQTSSPLTWGLLALLGCGSGEATGWEIPEGTRPPEAATRLLEDFGQIRLDPGTEWLSNHSEDAIRDAAGAMLRRADLRAEIRSRCDAPPDSPPGDRLATVVADELVRHGVPAERLSVVYCGDEAPPPHDAVMARSHNQNAELHVTWDQGLR